MAKRNPGKPRDHTPLDLLAENKDKRKGHAYLKYSGMALQFFVMIAIAAWAGQKLDAHFATAKPLWTAGLVVFFTIAYFYKMYRDLMRD